MSLPTISGTAKLLTDPKKALTRDRKPMANVVLKFQAWRKVDGKWVEGDHVVVVASAFDDTARALVQHAKGDDVDVVGTATLGMWQDKPQLRVVLAEVRAHVKQANRQAVAA